MRPKFRSVLLKSLGLTILVFVGIWLAAEALISALLLPFLAGWPIVSTIIFWLMGAGILVGAGFLLAPTTALTAGLFLDDVAEYVEQKDYPNDELGRPVPMGAALFLALRFGIIVILANLVALMLVLLPFINVTVFFLVNGYLLGREYFTFAAMRFGNEKRADQIRRQNGSAIFMAGLVIAGVMAVPILNLITPVFAAAMMVHLHKAIIKKHIT